MLQQLREMEQRLQQKFEDRLQSVIAPGAHKADQALAQAQQNSKSIKHKFSAILARLPAPSASESSTPAEPGGRGA